MANKQGQGQGSNDPIGGRSDLLVRQDVRRPPTLGSRVHPESALLSGRDPDSSREEDGGSLTVAGLADEPQQTRPPPGTPPLLRRPSSQPKSSVHLPASGVGFPPTQPSAVSPCCAPSRSADSVPATVEVSAAPGRSARNGAVRSPEMVPLEGGSFLM